MSLRIVCILSGVLLSCDADRVEFRSEEPAPGCDYSHLNLVWNDDHQNAPHECAAKLALCIDQTITGCDMSPDDCQAKIQHCTLVSDFCWKSTSW